MNVFMCWSGLASKKTAKILKKWLDETVFVDENINIFLSEDNIKAGSNWFSVLQDNLSKSDCAIICLTDDNHESPWINFESGCIAISKSKNAIPILINVSKSNIKGPFQHFQHIEVTKDDIHKLILDLKEIGKLKSPAKKHLDGLIQGFFEQLDEAFKKELALIDEQYSLDRFKIFPSNVRSLKKGKVFMGVPMASVSEKDYEKIRIDALAIKDAIIKYTGLKDVYCPAERIHSRAEFDNEKRAILDDFRILKESEHYVFIYPRKVASSILLEMGYAIALSKNTRIFTHKRSALPFMLKQANEVVPNLFIYEYKNTSDIIEKIRSEGDSFFSKVD